VLTSFPLSALRWWSVGALAMMMSGDFLFDALLTTCLLAQLWYKQRGTST